MGLVRDRQFGPAIMFGTGGIYAEALLDTALSIAPINKPEALSMIKSVKAYKLLEGARGKAPCDVDALADALVKLSELMDSYEDIQEVDINPVFVYESGCVAADARIIMEAKA